MKPMLSIVGVFNSLGILLVVSWVVEVIRSHSEFMGPIGILNGIYSIAISVLRFRIRIVWVILR